MVNNAATCQPSKSHNGPNEPGMEAKEIVQVEHPEQHQCPITAEATVFTWLPFPKLSFYVVSIFTKEKLPEVRNCISKHAILLSTK